jgi:basic membrane protein A and related proteins
MTKKLFIILTLLVIGSMLFTACTPNAEEPTEMATEEQAEEAPAEATEEDCPTDAVFCVGLVTDVGEVDDKSFNQSAWEGVQQAANDLGGIANYVETKDAKDYMANIQLFADKGYDVIVTVGFALGAATIEAADMYPEIQFIGVDQFQAEAIDNVAGLIFAEDKSGFLAGVLAGMLTETNTIAAVLGTDLVPPVVAFKEGYESGALWANPDIEVISTYHPGGLDVAFTDPEWGAATAAQALENGADVVFGAGGKTGNGALIEVAGYEGAYCIGVDSDQWGTVPEAHDCLVSSAMKLITPGVVDLVNMAYEDSFPAGNYLGEVGLAPFHDFEDSIGQDILDKLDEAKAGLEDGSISTGYGTAAPEEPEEETETPSYTEDDCAMDEALCVGLVTDVGEIDDKSFNQSAWEGVLQAQEEYGAVVNYVETKDAKDYMANIQLFADKGYDVIVTVGFALGAATIEAADMYPEIQFIGVDQFQAEAIDNVAGLIFAEDKSGFLAGVLAGMLTETNTIAAVLGTDLVPPVVAFKEGYESGALWANPDIEVISTYHPGGLDVAFTDPEWGAATAAQALENGADVVFGAGGKTGNGALIEVAGYEGAYCIGVDSDQWGTVPEAHDCLVSSAMKLITPGVVDLVNMAYEDSFPAGNYLGEVGLAPFHDFEDSIGQDILDKLDEAKAGLEDGSISSGYPPEE